MPKTIINIPPTPQTPHLIFRTRKTSDLVLCDYCQNYKCNWLDLSPDNYPKSCPGIREFWISDHEVPSEEFKRRTETARLVGLYLPFNSSWHLDATKTRSLAAEALMKLMDDINAWSARNKLSLCKMVEYVSGQDPRTTVQKKLSGKLD